MHEVKTQRLGELLVKNRLIIYFYMVIIKCINGEKFFNKFGYMVIIKTYKVKGKFFNKFLEISGKIRINSWKFSAGNLRKFQIYGNPMCQC